jgi:quercetin dioxygenase-like cupin family protein
MYFYPDFSKDLKKKRERVFFKSVTGNNAQMLYIRLEPGESTFHSHENEQMGYILSGEAELTINGEVQICKAGDGYYVPANIQHGFKVLNNSDVEYIEIFCPPKEENRL